RSLGQDGARFRHHAHGDVSAAQVNADVDHLYSSIVFSVQNAEFRVQSAEYRLDSAQNEY
ncbi:hypothetical protein, partial [Salmonella enterica]|uniref:hypothetical protein n=1 Tax=Salmonella enterica TaxID=28901 RepID=UPI003075C812